MGVLLINKIMKKHILLLVLFLATGNAFAHYMWVETNPTGKQGQKQEVKVYFGEYTYGLEEEVGGEAFAKMKDFEVWVVSPDGQKAKLEVKPGKKFYSGWFTPKANGIYTVALNNNKIDVIDYTQYNFGIFKTHYHSTAKVAVGTTLANTAAVNQDGLSIVEVAKTGKGKNEETVLQVMYKGQPSKETEITVFVADQWSKKMMTDANGQIKFALPWNTKYVIEATKKEEVPGKYNGKDYQFVWHCATYSMPVAAN